MGLAERNTEMSVEPTAEERLSFIKVARHTALVSDKLCSAVLELTRKLEEAQIIDPDRASKKNRDKKMKNNYKTCSVSDEEILKLVEQVKEHPKPEAIVASLFRDLTPAKVKRVMNNVTKKGEKAAAEAHE